MRRIFLCFLLMMMFLVPQVTMAASIDTNTPGASAASTIPSVKASGVKANAPVATKSEISSVRWLVHKEDDTTRLRLVFDTTVPVTVNGSLEGESGSRLTIDINGATLGKIASSLTLDGDIAEKAVFTRNGTSSSRVVIDLAGIIDDGDYKVFTLRNDPENNKPFRVVVDINKPIPKIAYNFTTGLQNKVIVIDPGHGGSDPGAIGINKTMEKTITLAVAQRVQALLEKAGAKVIMTRKTDVDVFGPNASAVQELSARTLVANKNKADIFLSIHINAFSNRTVGGSSTYYYQKTKYDALLAESIQAGLAKAGGLQDRGTYPARFYVIKRTVMPAVLTELAFISNPDEEKALNSPQFQQQLAQGIVDGLDAFFKQAARKGGNTL